MSFESDVEMSSEALCWVFEKRRIEIGVSFQQRDRVSVSSHDFHDSREVDRDEMGQLTKSGVRAPSIELRCDVMQFVRELEVGFRGPVEVR